ncbi:fructosamine kinase family protein [Alteromonas sp. KUL42]
MYQLYHILNHGLLFGAHYIAQAKQIISTITPL